MAYNDQTAFPRGIYRTITYSSAVSPLDIFAAGSRIRIAWIMIKSGGAGLYLVRDADDNEINYWSASTGALKHKVPAFSVTNGLRITTNSAATAHVTVAYYTD